MRNSLAYTSVIRAIALLPHTVVKSRDWKNLDSKERVSREIVRVSRRDTSYRAPAEPTTSAAGGLDHIPPFGPLPRRVGTETGHLKVLSKWLEALTQSRRFENRSSVSNRRDSEHSEF